MLKYIFALTFFGFFLPEHCPSQTGWTRLPEIEGTTFPQAAVIDSEGNWFLLMFARIYRSTDQGQMWTKLPYPDVNMYTLAVDSNNVLLAGGHGGAGYSGPTLFRSTDQGDSWTGLESYSWKSSAAIAVAPDGSYLVSGPNGPNLFRSNDNGNTWDTLGTGGFYTNLLTVLSDGTILARSAQQGYVRSNDGLVWTPQLRNGQELNRIYTYQVISVDSRRLYATSANGNARTLNAQSLLRSTDGGRTWSDISNSGSVLCAAWLGNDTLITQTINFKTLRSTNGGSTWQTIGDSPPEPCSQFIPDRSGVILAISPGGPYVSTDRGLTWEKRANGISSLILHEITTYGGSIVAPVEGLGVFKLNQDNLTWQKIAPAYSDIAYVTKLSDDNTLIGAARNSFWLKDSDSTTFSSYDYAVYGNALNGWVGFGTKEHSSIFAARLTARFINSTDLGKTWVEYTPPVLQGSPTITRLLKDDMGRLYINGGNKLFRIDTASLDGNGQAVWTELVTTPGSIVTSIYPIVEGRIACASSSTIWFSETYGDSWVQLPSLPDTVYFVDAVVALSDGSVFVAGSPLPDTTGTYTTVYRYIPSSGVWEVDGLNNVRSSVGLYASEDGVVYANLFEEGVYQRSMVSNVPDPRSASTFSVHLLASAGDATTVELQIAEGNKYTIDLYNILGQKVCALHADYLALGEHRFQLPVKDLAAGGYVLVVRSSNDQIISLPYIHR